jgi:hypothetical protein
MLLSSEIIHSRIAQHPALPSAPPLPLLTSMHLSRGCASILLTFDCRHTPLPQVLLL